MASHELLNRQLPVYPKGLEAFKNSALPTETETLHDEQMRSPRRIAS